MVEISMRKKTAFIVVLALAFTSYVFGQAVRSMSGSELQPIVVIAVPPLYPPIGRIGLITDDVVVEGIVHPSGVLIGTNVVSGHRALHQAAEAAARRWRFEPYTWPAEGIGNFRKARLTFMFRVMPDGTPEVEMLPVFYPPYKIEVRTSAVRSNEVNTSAVGIE